MRSNKSLWKCCELNKFELVSLQRTKNFWPKGLSLDWISKLSKIFAAKVLFGLNQLCHQSPSTLNKEYCFPRVFCCELRGCSLTTLDTLGGWRTCKMPDGLE